MPRNSSKGKKQATKETNPELIYDKLELSKRIACYNFWCYLNSDGQEGWDPVKTPASIWNWRSSNYLQANVKESSWPRIGKAMASLALDLQRRGIRLADPYNKHKEALAQLEQKQSETAEETDTQSEYSEYSEFTGREDDSIAEEKKMPSSILKKKASFAGGVSASKIDQQVANLSLDGACTLQTVKGFLSFSMLSGRWEEFDHDTDTMNGYCLMRMLIHNGSKVEDFQFSWVNNKTFKIRLKWPTFMQRCLMMTALDKDPFGRESYPRGHQVYNDMGKNARDLKDIDGNIWTEGHFVFKRAMDMSPGDSFDCQLFEVQVESVRCSGDVRKVQEVVTRAKSGRTRVFETFKFVAPLLANTTNTAHIVKVDSSCTNSYPRRRCVGTMQLGTPLGPEIETEQK